MKNMKLQKMRVEIHRFVVAGIEHEDGRISMIYDFLVPDEDRIKSPYPDPAWIKRGKEYYVYYPRASFACWLPPGTRRLNAWRAHLAKCQSKMLRWLHQHCPETREQTTFPSLWMKVDPEAAGFPIIKFTVNEAYLAPPEGEEQLGA